MIKLSDWIIDLKRDFLKKMGDERSREIDFFLKEKLPFLRQSGGEVSDQDLNVLTDFKERMLKGEPLTKIIGMRGFWKDEFMTSKDVLDPRPETEFIIEQALKYCGAEFKGKILELGTGSGCLILSLLREFPEAKADAVDLSDKALDIALKNAQKLEIEDRVTFFKSNWFENVTGEYDLIVSNPPYIGSSEIDYLDVSVRKYDPLLALDGGESGLEAYQLILSVAKKYMAEKSYLIFEIGYDQRESVQEIAVKNGFRFINCQKDYQNHDRVVVLQK